MRLLASRNACHGKAHRAGHVCRFCGRVLDDDLGLTPDHARQHIALSCTAFINPADKTDFLRAFHDADAEVRIKPVSRFDEARFTKSDAPLRPASCTTSAFPSGQHTTVLSIKALNTLAKTLHKTTQAVEAPPKQRTLPISPQDIEVLPVPPIRTAAFSFDEPFSGAGRPSRLEPAYSGKMSEKILSIDQEPSIRTSPQKGKAPACMIQESSTAMSRPVFRRFTGYRKRRLGDGESRSVKPAVPTSVRASGVNATSAVQKTSLSGTKSKQPDVSGLAKARQARRPTIVQ